MTPLTTCKTPEDLYRLIMLRTNSHSGQALSIANHADAGAIVRSRASMLDRDIRRFAFELANEISAVMGKRPDPDDRLGAVREGREG